MQDFRNLGAWCKAHALALEIYRRTGSLPREEIFGVTMQLRRVSVSIATRIVEGCGRERDSEFSVDLYKAVSSCNELEYLLLLAHDLGFLDSEAKEQLAATVVEVRKMIFGLLKKL